MKIYDNGIIQTDWSQLEKEKSAGVYGFSKTKTIEYGEIKLREVEYSPCFEADHWCSKGHIIFIKKGEIILEIKDGDKSKLKAGMSFVCGDETKSKHKVYSDKGAVVLIID